MDFERQIPARLAGLGAWVLALGLLVGAHRAWGGTHRAPAAGAADTSEAEAGSASDPLTEGRRVVERAIRVAGGMDAYRAVQGYRFRMITEDYRAGALAGAESSLVMFRRGGGFYREESRGTVVGSDGRGGWSRRAGQFSSTPQDSAIGTFLGATIPFWHELPFRFLDPAYQLHYAGSAGFDPAMPVEMRLKITSDHDRPAARPSAGTRFYDLVFVSSSDSTHPTDEYFAFFDRRSGRFRGCNFTLRAAGMKTLRWCSWFDDYHRAGALEFPCQQTWFRLANDNLPDMSEDRSGVLRIYRQMDLELNPGLPDSLFMAPGR